MNNISILLWILFIILHGIHILVQLVSLIRGLLLVKQRSRNKRNIITFNGHEDTETWPRVSIIKPIIIDDPKVKCLIENYFQLDYPMYEIHFCFQDSKNSCIQFVRQLSQQYPRIKVIIHSDILPEKIANKKILNIARATKIAHGELIWIVDENINVSITSLKEMVTQFDDRDVGCVHQIPMWKSKDTFQHAVNMTYFSTHHARFYLFSDVFRILCISGMSMLLDKEKLEEIGGLASFDRFVSEDYAITHALEQRGYKVKLAPSPALQDPCICSLSIYINRMIRWTKLRLNIVFFATILEPYIHPWLFAVTSATLLYFLIGFPFVFSFIFFILFSFVLDQSLMIVMHMAFPEQGPLPPLYLRIQAFISIQFFLIPYIFSKSIGNFRKIDWHTASYDVTWGTVILKPEEYETKKDSLLLKRFKRFKELQSQE